MNAWSGAAAVAAAIVINEVLYDPAGADGEREFVELWVRSGSALDGWSLEAGDGARGTWRSVWRGAGLVAAETAVVIGGDSVPGAAARLQGELQNGPDAVRLVDPSGAIADCIGYGALQLATFYETAPAPDAAGESLARDPDGNDTDDNRRDFVVARPSPGRRNRPLQDLELALAAPDPLHAWPGRTLRAVVTVRNRGVVAQSAWDLEAHWERTHAGSVQSRRQLEPAGARGARLAPGDSATCVFAWQDDSGLYRLDIRGRFAEADSSADRVTALVRIGSGALVVDELLYAPETGAPEWLEVWNRGTEPMALAGFTIVDRGGRRATVRGAAWLGAGARGIVAADTVSAIPALAPGTPRWAATPWPALNDTGEGWADALVVRDAAGIVTDAFGYPAAAGERGRSLERLTPDADARGVGWTRCTAPEGSTPGAVNSTTGAGEAAAVQLAVTPNPFSPDGDGRDDQVRIRAVVPPGYSGCRVEIYDVEGRRRRRLVADALGPGPRTLAWDGVSDGGVAAEAGVYICVFECHSRTRPEWRVKRAVGLVRP
jgi:hypothetical protein